MRQRISGTATVADRVSQYQAAVGERLMPDFQKAGIAYPPAKLTMIAIKDQKNLELYAAGPDGKFSYIKTYPILAASGHLGPKLREGDMQVPEGFYAIESLNPNSSYHLALRVNYPNDLDRRMAKADGRTNLGGDIMIHGSSASAGCLAMGDQTAEDLFILVALTGLDHTELLITPTDFRLSKVLTFPNAPSWSSALYVDLQAAMQHYPQIPAPPK